MLPILRKQFARCIRRDRRALYDALDAGVIDTNLRTLLAGLPIPRMSDGRISLAVDMSNWLRPGVATIAERSGDATPCSDRADRPQRRARAQSMVASSRSPDPDTWHTPEVHSSTPTDRYGLARVQAWDRLHPRSSRRSALIDDRSGDLPVIDGT